MKIKDLSQKNFRKNFMLNMKTIKKQIRKRTNITEIATIGGQKDKVIVQESVSSIQEIVEWKLMKLMRPWPRNEPWSMLQKRKKLKVKEKNHVK